MAHDAYDHARDLLDRLPVGSALNGETGDTVWTVERTDRDAFELFGYPDWRTLRESEDGITPCPSPPRRRAERGGGASHEPRGDSTMRGFTGHEVATNVTDREVTYHGTTVASRNGRTVTLRTGGWSTVTTKRRMNQAAVHWGLPFTVYQDDHEWFVRLRQKGETLPFDSDTITFTP